MNLTELFFETQTPELNTTELVLENKFVLSKNPERVHLRGYINACLRSFSYLIDLEGNCNVAVAKARKSAQREMLIKIGAPVGESLS